MDATVHIVGGGLAGVEAAWQLAERGVQVRLSEMRPVVQTPVHHTGNLAELVCSNSLKSMNEESAAGLLKHELRSMGSLLLTLAEEHRVPAGGALAVDRTAFSQAVTDRLSVHPNITVLREELTALPGFTARHASGPASGSVPGPVSGAVSKPVPESALESTSESAPASASKRTSQPASEPAPGPAPAFEPSHDAHLSVIVAAGPLASPALSAAIAQVLGTDALAFFDAAAPIVETESLDKERLFAQSRYDKGASSDYLNASMDEKTYNAFITALLEADRVVAKDFESAELFKACQPIEEVARTGRDALRYGALKPVGLTDPRREGRAHAVVQLRAENTQTSAYNLVGFQTNLTFAEQRRVFRMIPGLEQAEFLRYGVMHRNTFIDAPRHLDTTFALPAYPHLRFAGQITGTEGYCEAIASGLYVALCTYADIAGLQPPKLPHNTAFGALVSYATDPDTVNYQPMHVNFGLVEPLPGKMRKAQRYAAYAKRAHDEMEAFLLSRPDLFTT